MGLGVQSHRSHDDSQLATLTPGITRIEDTKQHQFTGSYHQPIDRHDYQSGHFKEVEEGVHPVPMSAGNSHQIMGQYQQPHEAGEKPRGRERSREGMREGGLGGALSSSTEPQTRKRRRSRKGLDKKFECPQQGCGRAYSRAEHLYRHQLNRKDPLMLFFEFEWCLFYKFILFVCKTVHSDLYFFIS